ncbi:MAG: radical SAM protein, partial [Elusimicrobiota bacterium]|nr:radical SAM protein [Elusimicrobiota bacterium]
LGEGEIPMLAIAKEFDSSGDINFNTIPGAAFIENGQYREIPKPELISDLDNLPYPEQPFKDASARRSIVSLISSRGCPGQCTFCANVCLGHKFRVHSPEYIINEMIYLADKYNIKSFRFVDDCFTADAKRVIEICDRIIEKRLDIKWWVSGRMNTVRDETMVMKMKQAGCIAMQLGIETGNQRINDLMKKGTTLEMAETCCSLLRKHEIATLSSFIIGNEGDTVETARETIAFAKKLKSTTTTFHMFIPYPGTPLFKKYYNDYDRPDTNWDFWCSEGLNRPYEPRQTNLSKKDIVRLRNRAYWRLYSNPFQILRTIAFAMDL